jgi:hypothetical protein
MKKIENPAKLSKGCKKKRDNKCKFVPKYSMLSCFFQTDISKDKTNSGVRRWGAGVGKGRLSQPMAYKRKSDGVVNGGLSRVA